MQYKKIMVAYDGSEPSNEALVVAKDLIDNDADTKLHVVTIVAVGSLGLGANSSLQSMSGMQQIFPDMTSYEEALQGAKDLAMQSMDEAIESLIPNAGFEIEKDVIFAVKAADGICEYAKSNNIEMIIMGRRGLGAIGAMLGSVSYSVLHQMGIPVVTVR